MENRYGKSARKKGSQKNAALMMSVGVVAGIVGGLLLILIGLILSIISYFNQTNFHGLELMLFLGAFVLIAAGAHALDQYEAEEKAKRIAYCKQNGWSVGEGKDYVWVSEKVN